MMRYFRNAAGGPVMAFDQGDPVDEYLPAGYVEMSAGEVSAYLDPTPAYWTDGVVLVLSSHEIQGWRRASQIEIDVLLPALQLREAMAETAHRRAGADSAIAPLQDAVDLDDATDAEAALLKEWKRYRIALNRLPDQLGYPNTIDWPAPPA
ncbi:tail fiber assembly protein [Pseudomonas entomophila]|uniref:tail fiber assembly protein n=1 Tax=Pseudomonas entomophila TaxID=312306 RepID=UPI002404E12E|nr:tail fiber assembly protein [Pseudomonas entomophila]MDF9617033.1 tail fiber assembly protein [Pseudomonas entomophila]